MHPNNFLKKWPSVSAAAAMLLGLQRSDANTGEVSKPESLKSGDPYEPLILKPSKSKFIPEQLFAGHRSHSSHSSHSSGSSGSGHASHASHASGTSSGSYTPTTPSYVPLSTPRPSSSIAPQTTPRPTPIPTPIEESVSRIDLTNGAVIYGTVLAKSAAGITFRGVDQKDYKIPRLILSQSTISALALPAEQ